MQKRNSELIKIIKRSRHLHATVKLSAQTISDSMLDLKRIATDIVIFRDVSRSDMDKLLDDIYIPTASIPQGMKPKDYILELQRKLPNKKSKIIIHIANDRIVVEE